MQIQNALAVANDDKVATPDGAELIFRRESIDIHRLWPFLNKDTRIDLKLVDDDVIEQNQNGLDPLLDLRGRRAIELDKGFAQYISLLYRHFSGDEEVRVRPAAAAYSTSFRFTGEFEDRETCAELLIKGLTSAVVERITVLPA